MTNNIIYNIFKDSLLNYIGLFNKWCNNQLQFKNWFRNFQLKNSNSDKTKILCIK